MAAVEEAAAAAAVAAVEQLAQAGCVAAAAGPVPCLCLAAGSTRSLPALCMERADTASAAPPPRVGIAVHQRQVAQRPCLRDGPTRCALPTAWRRECWRVPGQERLDRRRGYSCNLLELRTRANAEWLFRNAVCFHACISVVLPAAPRW